jgi:stage II sporulation protein M
MREAPWPITTLFDDSAEYVWALRRLFLLSLLLFSSSIAIGYTFGDRLPVDPLEEFRRLLPNPKAAAPLTLFLFIAANNLAKSLIWMLLGLLFSLPPILFIILNGFYLGWASHIVAEERGLLPTLVALAPHGVIEVPTILLSSAAGIALGHQVINRLRGRKSLLEEVRRALILYIYRIAPLLILSALVEVSLTPLLTELLGIPSS